MLLHKIKSFSAILCAVIILGTSATVYAQDNSDQLSSWRQAAQSGDADAAILLGDTYRNGWGVEKNQEEAFKWYKMAVDRVGIAGAEKGNQGSSGAEAANKSIAGAEFAVGQAYWTGHGVAQDFKEALKYWSKAAYDENAEAQNALGDAYFSGQHGIPQDKVTAISWYQKAAIHNNPDAEYSLAEAYHNGDGIAKDDKEAISLYHKALEKGNAQASKRIVELEGSQTGLFHMKGMPSIGWLIILVIVAIGLMFFIIEMRNRGVESYGLKFIVCPEFGMLIFGSIFFYITNMPTGACDINGQDVLFCDGGGNDAAKWVALLTFIATMVMNIKKTNPAFGVLYTLAQIFTAYTFFPAFLIEIFKKVDRRKR